jgi:hypothetical protein
MNKDWVCPTFLALCLSIGFSALGFSQEKEKEKKKETGIAVTAERLTISKEKGRTIMQTDVKADDFSVEPKKYINLQVDLLEIKPSKTVLIASPKIKIENGQAGNTTMGRLSSYISISFIPIIIEDQGIEIKVEFIKTPEMTEKREEKIFLKNAESAVLELFENKAKKSKLAIRMTPLIEVVNAAKAYPRPITELRLSDSFLLLNEDRLIAQGSLEATSDEDDIYLFFSSEKGLFVLSFKPFEGAEAKGVAYGKILKIRFGDDEFEWTCRESILPEGRWLVWMRHNPSIQKIAIEKGTGIIGKNGLIGIGTGKDSWKRFF